MITSAQATIKNLTGWQGNVGKVTLFTGPNRSGKTAVQEAIRLALTNTCSVGASPAKQKLLASGNALAQVSGENFSGCWALRDGKRTHSLSYGGMEVKSVTGDAPLTVEEYWALTGEQRWAMVESIVGPFSENPPDKKDASRATLKALKSQVAPPAYEGQSIPELKRLIAHYESIIKSAIESREESNARLRQLQDLTNNRKHTQQLLDILKGERDRLHRAISENLLGQVTQILVDWQTSPGNVLSGCSNMKEAVDTLTELCIEKLSAMNAVLDGKSPFAQVVQYMLATMQAMGDNQPEDLETFLLDSGSIFSERLADKFAEYGFQINSVSTMSDAINERERLLLEGKLEKEHAKCLELIAKAENSIKQHDEQIAELEGKEPAAYSDAESASQQLDSLKEQLAKATAYQEWLDGAEKRAEKIKELEAEVTSADKDWSEYSKRRADYLSGAASLVSDKANEILGQMGFPKLSIEIDTTGKRNTLTAVSDGVDIQAMAGSEKLLYGVALVNAFHELGKTPMPVLFIEAAELSGENLAKLLGSLLACRTKGNVLVSHWFDVQVEGVVTHRFGG